MMNAIIFLFTLIQLAASAQSMPFHDSGATNKSALRERAVVVGGGPVGLASAIMLANEGYDVSVFEAMPLSQMNDPSLSYTYGINPKGQSFTKMFPNLHEKLVKTTLPVREAGIMVVPADNTKPIIRPEFDRGRKSKSYYIARNELVLLLREAVDKHNKDRRNPDCEAGKIDFEPGMKCIDINPSSKDDNCINVVFQNTKTGEEKGITGTLVVGADGIRSKVRESLKENQGQFKSWGYRAKRFKMKKRISPSSGMKLKAFQLAADRYSIIESDGSKIATKNTDYVLVLGENKNPKESLRLSSFPVKDSAKVRQSLCTTTPDHLVWTMKSGPAVKSWYEDNFKSRVNFDGLVSDEEWDRFAKSKGVTFPPCQYSPGLQASAKNGECGIVLLGDAAHAFGPDIGQGVNSGLADVVQLQKSLASIRRGDETSRGRRGTLGEALKAYERVQAPETRALVHICRYGNPYQFNRPGLKFKIGKTLWTANLLVRGLLRKVTFGLFPGQLVHILTTNEMMSYRQMARRADGGTVVLTAIFILALVKLFA